jgi:biopolymer transport protein TolR
MAGGMDLGVGGKGRKRPLDAAINLVPFIDLMAVTISFLIMTAVWNQISSLKVSQAGGPPVDDPTPRPATIPLVLVVSERGFTLTGAGTPIEIPRSNGAFVFCHSAAKDRIDENCEDKTLVGELRRIKGNVPGQNTITVQVEDGVRYGDLVRVLDACNLKDAANQPTLFPDVAVSAIG